MDERRAGARRHSQPSAVAVFGGNTLTTSDVAVAAGLIEMGDKDRVRDLDPAFVKASLERIRNMVTESFDQMKTSAEDVPLIAVGGVAFLIPEKIAGASELLRVENVGVANALGAAMAQVSGEVDQVFSGLSRDEAIGKAEAEAQGAAVASGASRKSLKTLEVEDIPIAYLPGGARRVRVRVIGDIAFSRNSASGSSRSGVVEESGVQ